MEEGVIQEYDLVVLSDCLEFGNIMKISKSCRKLQRGFIYAAQLGLMMVGFVDFGNSFTIFDKDGMQSAKVLISGIQSDEGAVYYEAKNENYEEGEFVRISDVKGMTLN